MRPLTKAQVQKLIAVAKKTRDFAFCHRSNHKMGASVLIADGSVFGGCNVESVISGLGECAERCAINNAVANGKYDIRAICCVDKVLTPPCGACLQYMMLFAQATGQDIIVVKADAAGRYVISSLYALLPDGYRTKHVRRIREYLRRLRGKRKRASS